MPHLPGLVAVVALEGQAAGSRRVLDVDQPSDLRHPGALVRAVARGAGAAEHEPRSRIGEDGPCERRLLAAARVRDHRRVRVVRHLEPQRATGCVAREAMLGPAQRALLEPQGPLEHVLGTPQAQQRAGPQPPEVAVAAGGCGRVVHAMVIGPRAPHLHRP